ncbi:MAG TPA: hypothetical protein VFT20_05625 [Candidatus Limnocylindrales bacterium]|nr:hypothetical protein [Candidatus Limnocylindrales bacterium]
MTDVHVVLAWAAAAGIAALLTAGLAVALGVSSRAWLDRAILLQLGTALAASVGGVVLVAMGRGPSDPLHVVYGAVLVVGPLATRYLARQEGTRRIAVAMTLAAAIGAGVVARSFLTGG